MQSTYHIPIVTPIYIGEPKTSGRTRPLQMRCENNAECTDYIVKLWANPEVFLGKHSLAREIYGSILARQMGLNTPDIAIVDIDTDFHKSIQNESTNLIRNSTGYNFGSKYIPGAIIFSPPVPHSKIIEATTVFCFDMLIGNPDRRVGKPNVFQTSDGFIVYDHEQAFPFACPNMMLGGYPAGWLYIREDWHKKHIFYSSIKKEDCCLAIESFITNLDSLSDDLLVRIEQQIPEDWHTGNYIQNISSYLANTRENSHLFKRSLQEILA